ncbi:MAG: peptidoglycan-binding protein [Byssovorax sp.]
MTTLPAGVTASRARAIVITDEELACFPLCLHRDSDELHPSLWVPAVPPWAPPDWGSEAYATFRVKVLKARQWWSEKGELPPNPLPADAVYESAARALADGTAKPVEVRLEDEEEAPAEVAPPEAPAALEPVGKGDYVVRSGDCLASIAFAHGHAWSTLWRHPDNADLRKARKDPNVLFPGDRVTIPPVRQSVSHRATGARHRYVLKTTPARLNLELRWGGEPRAGEPYELEIGGQVRKGVLGSKGELSEPIVPDVRTAILVVGEGGRRTEMALQIGSLLPASALAGAQSRLVNLGYLAGDLDGAWDARTRKALQQFQRDAGLDPTGELDQATGELLVSVHDGV